MSGYVDVEKKVARSIPRSSALDFDGEGEQELELVVKVVSVVGTVRDGWRGL